MVKLLLEEQGLGLAHNEKGMIMKIIEFAEKDSQLEPQEYQEEDKTQSNDPVQAIIASHLKIKQFLAEIESFILVKKGNFKTEAEQLIKDFQQKVSTVVDV